MNLVEITVRTKDEATSQLRGFEQSAKKSGESAGKGFSDSFSKGANSNGGLFSGLFGKNSSSSGDQAGRDAGNSFVSGFKNAVNGRKGELSGFLKNLFAGSGGGLNAGGIAGGALPGMLGVSGKNATYLGLGGAALGALPALAAVGATTSLLGAGAGVISAGVHQLVGQKDTKANPNAQGPLYAEAQQITKTFQSVMRNAASGMMAPLKSAFAQIPSMLKNIEPALKSVFAGAGTLIGPLVQGIGGLAKSVLPGLGAAFKAVAPLITPLMSGIGGLVKGVLPGLVTMLKAAMPAISALASVLTTIGKGLGSMFTAFAPALRSSSVIFKALGDVIAALFPIVGKLASVLASALAPTFAVLAGVIKALLPAVTPLVNILASFAGAVLSDLAGVLGAVGTLLKNLAPSFVTLAKAADQVFTALENNGVFAILGNALESLAGPLANLVNALVKGLAPALPGIITAFSAIAKVLTVGLVTILAALANALATIVKVIPPGVMTALADAFVAVYTAVKLWSAAQVVLNVALTANPIGIIIVALAALAAGITIAWQKSATFRDILKDIAKVVLQVGIVVLEENKAIVNAFLWMAGTVVHAAASAFGWVPGLGSKLKGAATAFDGFRAGVNNSFDSMISKMKSWQNELGNSQNKANTATQVISGDFGKQLISTNASTKGVNTLAAAIGALHGKTVTVGANATASGTISIVGSGWAAGQGNIRFHAAQGAYISTGSGPTADDNLAKVSKGELIVPANMVAAGEADNMRGRIPGFAAGGVIGGMPQAAAAFTGTDSKNAVTSGITSAMAAAKAAVLKAVEASISSAGSTTVSGSGPVGGDSAANKALARKMFPWPASQWAAFDTLEMHEAGYNRFARNSASGAYGIPQALPPTKMPFAAQQAGGSHAGPQLSWMFSYIRSVYGTPGNAWAKYYQHPGGVGWYANGGATSAGWAMVGERGRELVKVPGGATVYPAGATAQMAAGGHAAPTLVQLEIGGGSTPLEQAMASWMKNYVRIKGGGNVQKAFGQPGR